MATVIRHPKGNTLRIRIPITERITKLERGVATSADQDYIPNANYPVKVVFVKGATKVAFTATMEDNVAQIIDYGTLDYGVYALELHFRDENAHPMRWKMRAVVEVVDQTADAGMQSDGDELTAMSRYPVTTGEAGVVDEDGFITFQAGRHFKEDEDPTDEYADAGSGYGSGTVTIDEDYVTLNI